MMLVSVLQDKLGHLFEALSLYETLLKLKIARAEGRKKEDVDEGGAVEAGIETLMLKSLRLAFRL